MAKLLMAVRSEILSTALAEILTQYEVYSCHTGADALTLLDTLRPDIFIMELSLPVFSGLSVLQRTRYTPPVILALTNLISEKVLQAAADAGVLDMILLPCSARRIIRHLETLVQKIPAPEG